MMVGHLATAAMSSVATAPTTMPDTPPTTLMNTASARRWGLAAPSTSLRASLTKP